VTDAALVIDEDRLDPALAVELARIAFAVSGADALCPPRAGDVVI